MLLMTFALIMPELVPNTNQGWGDKVQVAITSFSLNPHIKKKSAAFDIFDDAVQIDSCISDNLLGTRIFSNPWANMDVVHFCSVSGCQSCVKKKQEHNWVAKSISCLFLKTLFSFPRRNEGQLRVIQTCTLMVFSTIFSEMSQLKLTCQKKNSWQNYCLWFRVSFLDTNRILETLHWPLWAPQHPSMYSHITQQTNFPNAQWLKSLMNKSSWNSWINNTAKYEINQCILTWMHMERFCLIPGTTLLLTSKKLTLAEFW